MKPPAALLAIFFFFSLSPLHAEPPEVRNLSNRRYFDETLAAIQNARRSILFVMYHLPLDPSNHASPVTRLVEALIEAKGRGVGVQAILDQEIDTERAGKGAPMKNLRAFHFLKENGISVSFDSLGKRTHAKLLVIDEEIVILGSTNWSREALDQNYEANLWVRSPEMAQAILEDFKAIPLLEPEKNQSGDRPLRGQSPFLRVSRTFLLDKNLGPRLVDEHEERALRVYAVILSGAAAQERLREGSRPPKDAAGPPPVEDPSALRPQDDGYAINPAQGLSPQGTVPAVAFDYGEAAKLLGIAHMSREAYRRQIIKVLKKLDKEYKLIRFEPRHGKEALVTLLDPVPQANYFEIPRGLFSGGWLHTLSLRALYSLLVLYDQRSYPRASPTIEVGLETLEKRYFVSRQTLGDGFRELAREDLLEIYYGKAIDFQKLEFETASYVLLPFYDPAARAKKFRELEALYGKEAFKQARDYAGAFFKEKDPEVIETLIGLRWTYSPEWLDLAMQKVILEKDVGNPARSLPYLIGILKQWKEKGRPAFTS